MRQVLRNLLFVLAAFLLIEQAANATSFYFIGHPDDVELFMARNAFYDVKSGAKVVFVVTTAGAVVVDSNGNIIQSGTEPYPGLGPNPYYLSREAGHSAALGYWYTLQNKPLGSNNVTNVSISGRTIARTEIGGTGSNVIMYNLHLRDGLNQFRKASLTDPSVRISTIDGSTSFTWTELKAFVRALIEREQNASDTWISIPEYTDATGYDANGNYTVYANGHYDHFDHIETGRLVSHSLLDSTPTRCIRTVQWVGYAASQNNWPLNFTQYEQSVQLTTWNTLNDAMVAAQGPDTRNPEHSAYLYRNYLSSNGQNGVTNFGPCQ